MDIVNGPCEQLSVLLEQISLLAEFIGMKVLHAKYSANNKMMKVVGVVMVTYLYITIYTFEAVKGDFVASVFCLVTFGVYSQTVMKIYVFVVHRVKVLQLSRQFHVIYARNAEHSKRKIILDRFLGYCALAFKAIKFLYVSVSILFGLCPLIVGTILNQRVLPFGFFLPFFDYTTSPGFEINYILSMCLVALSMTGLTASEAYFVIHIVLGIGHLNMMMMEMLEGLNELLRKLGIERDPKLEKEIEMKIKEILFEHQEHIRYMRQFENVFSKHSLLMVGTASLMIIVCLVVLVNSFWLVGFFMITMALWQILFICALGTAYESSCEQFAEKLYTIDWYLMTPTHRKYIRLMMQMAQRPPTHTMGGFLPCNLNSFMLVLRQMWSILMMLLRIADQE